MSNKAKSRKMKYLESMIILARLLMKIDVDFRIKMQKLREEKYPKLAPGGICYGTSYQIEGREMVVPEFGFKGATPYDNEPYLFQNN